MIGFLEIFKQLQPMEVLILGELMIDTSFVSEPVDMDFVWKYDRDFLVCSVMFGVLTKICLSYLIMIDSVI